MNQDEFVAEGRKSTFHSKIKMYILIFLSIPKTLYFNLRVFPFLVALRLPVFISYKVKLIEMHKHSIRIDCPLSLFMVKFGISGSDGVVERKGAICLERGEVVFKGRAVFAEGISLRNSAEITFGHDFYCNRNCTIWASEKISIGSDVTFGWNIVLRDCDGHLVSYTGVTNEYKKPIVIGNHSWICSETHLLKGTEVGNDCIVGYRSLVTKNYNENNVLIAGHPAKIIRYNINWVHGK